MESSVEIQQLLVTQEGQSLSGSSYGSLPRSGGSRTNSDFKILVSADFKPNLQSHKAATKAWCALRLLRKTVESRGLWVLCRCSRLFSKERGVSRPEAEKVFGKRCKTVAKRFKCFYMLVCTVKQRPNALGLSLMGRRRGRSDLMRAFSTVKELAEMGVESTVLKRTPYYVCLYLAVVTNCASHKLDSVWLH